MIFKPQSTQRAQRGPSVAGDNKKNGVGLLRHWKDYVGRECLQILDIKFLSNRGHRGTEGPLDTGYAESNGLGLLRQWNDYTSMQVPHKHTTCALGIARPDLKKILNQLVSGFSFPLCALWLKTSGSQLSKERISRQGNDNIGRQGPQKHTSCGLI